MASSTPSAPDFEGNDRFQLLCRLGQGGMGVVYKAHDRERGTRVALKTLRQLSADGILLFKNEFRALQDLTHPNLVSLHELISERGQWFFTMELVDGVDFHSWVRPQPGFERRPTPSETEVESDRVLASRTEGATVPPRGGVAAYEARAALTADRPPLDDRRLRAALMQLARGLTALHAAGKVHRDIKPSNVLVTRDGRVVLLDFGLVTDVGNTAYSELSIVGTADYMAPEQAASQPLGPPADWYSMGVVLYEALTGRLPFPGAPIEVLLKKRLDDPVPPRSIDPTVPEDLDALCRALLHRDPAARPTDAEVLRALGMKEHQSDLRLAQAVAQTQAPPFVGRAPELAELDAAFRTTLRGAHPVTVVVHGESGIGKSALVRTFIERLKRDYPEAVTLTGRCYERESVPYKALDRVIDNLARHMMRLPKPLCASLLPLRVGLLAQAFPVLRRVEAVAEAPARAPSSAMDPHEQRTRVFEALRELFLRLSDRQPLALVIDDLQWADEDSKAMLAHVLQPPEAPALLLVTTLRPVGEPVSKETPLPYLSGDVRGIQLERLPPPEARELAELLVRRTLDVHGDQPPRVDAQAIADEAHGHPLFIDELVRHSVDPTGDTRPGMPLQLEEALWARIQRLAPPARQLLDLATIAGRPVAHETAARALRFDPAEVARHVGLLKAANLVRPSQIAATAGAREAYETFHDRVRTAVLLHLDEPGTRQLNESLALALEAGGHADPEALCRHWRGAGDNTRAADYAAQAAEQAVAALAFDRAARRYKLALSLRPDGESALEWHTRRGEALASAGRSGEAALAYLQAAKRAAGTDAVELQRRGAEQLLVSGHIDEGLAGLRLVLASFDLALATTPRAALVSLTLRRLRLRLRGLRFRERQEREVPLAELRRIDLCWSVAIGLGMVDNARGSDFQVRHLLLALEAGEPYRVARALALEGAFVASLGGPMRSEAQRLLTRGAEVAQRIGHPHAIAIQELARGVSSFFVGEWHKAYQCCVRSLELFREGCTNVSWEVNMAHQFAMLSLAMLGEVAELARHVPPLRRYARERGDLYAGSVLRSGLLSLFPLAADEPDRAQQDIADGLQHWSQQGFHMQHYWELQGKVSCDLYVSDGRTALDRMTARWPVMEKSLLLRVQFIRVQAHTLRARACLATVARLVPGDPEREQLLALATADARVIEREGMAWTQPLALLVHAGVAATRGETARAIALLDQAAAAFDAAEMRLYAACARRRRGALEGGRAGAALIAEADGWMTEQRIKNPQRIAALFAPGFPD